MYLINLRDGRVVKIKEEIKQINTNRKQIEKQEMMDRFDIKSKDTKNIFEDIDHHIEYLSDRHGLKFDLENTEPPRKVALILKYPHGRDALEHNLKYNIRYP